MKITPKRMGILRLCPIFILTFFLLSGFAHPTKWHTLYDSPIPGQQQEYILTGTVKDSYGPLPGVHVLIKGTNTGTFTDKDGTFAITVAGSNTLVFSYVGYKTLELSILGRNTVEVELLPEATQLQEVEVNAGYYTVKERERTGSISRVTAKEIELQPVSNPLAALQGRMPGVEIVQQTGIPGGNFSVRIRGQNSVRLFDATANDPLYIIDGLPISSASLAFNDTSGQILTQGISPLGGINPYDIESIEVLKDADATAIYGSRGANGVVLINTKKGKVGKTSVKVNLSSGLGTVVNKVTLLNTDEYLTMRREAFMNDGRDPGVADYDINGSWDESRNTNWQKELIGNAAYITDAQASVSSGNTQTQFLVGGAHRKETTVYPGDNAYQRTSAHLSLGHKSLNNKFHLNVSTNYSYVKNELPGIDLTDIALSLPPNAPALYDENGNLNWEYSTWTNPLSYLKKQYISDIHQLVNNMSLEYELSPKLKLKLGIGYSRTTTKAVNTTPKGFYDPAYVDLVTHYAIFSNSDYNSWIAEPQLRYSSQLGNGTLDVLFGSSFQDQQREGVSVFADGFSNETLLRDLGSAARIEILSSSFSEYRYHAVFGRVNYNLKGRYFLNLTGRRDASSRFGPGKQWGNFGAIGLAWLFSEEPYVEKHWSFLNFGKLKGSYGITGNDKIGDYAFLDSYTVSGSYQGESGLVPTRLFNPDFGWEVNKKAEVGLDLGLFNNIVSISSSYYHNISSNQLVGMPLPPTTGFTSVQSNLPAKVRNTGIEMTINTLVMGNKDFVWNTGLNITVPRTTLVEFPYLKGSTYESFYQVGEPLSIRKVYRSDGVDPETGIYVFEDLDGSGFLDSDDRVAIFAGQDFYGGLSNSITYKGFQFGFHFQFVRQYGNSLMNYTVTPARFMGNQPVEIMDRWKMPGDVSSIQRFTSIFSPTATASNNWKVSDASVVDASYIRLKNVSLAYDLPEKIIEKMGITRVQCYLRGQNLLTITNYTGLDPETIKSGKTLPPLKTLTLGIHLTL